MYKESQRERKTKYHLKIRFYRLKKQLASFNNSSFNRKVTVSVYNITVTIVLIRLQTGP